MQITIAKDAKEELRRALAARLNPPGRSPSFQTGLHDLDALAPAAAFQRGAVHELLYPRQSLHPQSFALLLAKAAQQNGGAIAWTDPCRELYLPAFAAAGVSLANLILLRCRDRDDQLWAITQCLRCSGISAAVASFQQLNQLEARRLQLAAERGGGVGIFLRPHIPSLSDPYAAATRWLIAPAPGAADAQRWSMRLLHGHGGHVGKVLLLEVDREKRTWTTSPLSLHSSPPLADRPPLPAPARASA